MPNKEELKKFWEQCGIKKEYRVKHWCGLQGFGQSTSDTCPACDG